MTEQQPVQEDQQEILQHDQFQGGKEGKVEKFQRASWQLETLTLPESDRIERLKVLLPDSHLPYTDKYFIRSKEILQAEGLNPFVRAQVFVRKGPGTIHGIEEALACIQKYSLLIENGGRILGVKEGARYQGGEVVLQIEGRAQDLIELETIMLGAISRSTTAANDEIDWVDLEKVTARTREIKNLIGDRDIVYGGARHWGWEEDALIARAAYDGGAIGASTDIGAETFAGAGVGTIPHALEVIFAWRDGMDRAVREATLAFDRHMPPEVPRTALVDFNNREVSDAVLTAHALGGRLDAVRIDTCGENVSEHGAPMELRPYWGGRGVTITGVAAVRNLLNLAGFEDVKIILSSGFGNVDKVRAFVEAENELGMRLFDSLLVGGLYSPCRMATMDVVAVADRIEDLDTSPFSKVGREARPISGLQVLLGRSV